MKNLLEVLGVWFLVLIVFSLTAIVIAALIETRKRRALKVEKVQKEITPGNIDLVVLTRAAELELQALSEWYDKVEPIVIASFEDIQKSFEQIRNVIVQSFESFQEEIRKGNQ